MRSTNPVGFPACTVVGLIRGLCANPFTFLWRRKDRLKKQRKKYKKKRQQNLLQSGKSRHSSHWHHICTFHNYIFLLISTHISILISFLLISTYCTISFNSSVMRHTPLLKWTKSHTCPVSHNAGDEFASGDGHSPWQKCDIWFYLALCHSLILVSSLSFLLNSPSPVSHHIF